MLRDRPFNLKGGGGVWFFVSFGIFFSDNTRVRIFTFFVAQSTNFFFQNSTLGYITKTLKQIIFFPPPKSEYLFQQHWSFPKDLSICFIVISIPRVFELIGKNNRTRCARLFNRLTRKTTV